VGLGIVSYVEGTGVGPYEGARVGIEPGGRINLVTGVGTQGQGHFTSFAQIVAEQLGVGADDVEVVTGDTARFGWGTGTFASRGAVVAGNACHAAALEVRQKVLALASSVLGAAEEDLDLADGLVRVVGSGESVSLGELAARANPLRGAVAPGTEPGLEATAYFGPERGVTASGVHAMILEVDPETAMIRILRYVVVHDCGRVINPMIVEGQIHGGVAHGIGNAFYEELVFDEGAQLQNASFRADHRDGPRRDALAAQPAGSEGRGRSRSDPGGRAVRPGDRGRARHRRVRDTRHTTESEPPVRADPRRA
jgi:CO/xanthine dehydrogenase Mo-binding subunit